MLNILYLSFYYEPDLSAGSFRNTSLSKELAARVEGTARVHVITTQPNRYKTFRQKAAAHEERGNLVINRVEVPEHQSGFMDQLYSYRSYYNGVMRLTKGRKYDLVFVSSSRLFSSYIGRKVADRNKCPLYLDIRDLFVDNMKELIRNPGIKYPLHVLLKWIEKQSFTNADHINLVSEGFRENFKKFPKPNYSYYSNGIDDVFLGVKQNGVSNTGPLIVTYAGNIGEGQGLDKVIPQAAEALGDRYLFRVIGDGGIRPRLEAAVQERGLKNVEILNPVKRDELLKHYQHSHFLFLHLNDYEAFKKVLPSKIFEYGATNIPVIAGVSGYAAEFVRTNLTNSLLFRPCQPDELVGLLRSYQYRLEDRTEFVEHYRRSNITRRLAESIASYLKKEI